MKRTWRFLLPLLVLSVLALDAHGALVKRVLDARTGGQNLLRAEAWRPYERGFTSDADAFMCDNGSDAKAHRGVTQTVRLNQTTPQPIIAVAWSKAENVGGPRDGNYSLYLDLLYTDGTQLWGQTTPFSIGTHDWERREVVVLPSKPVKSVSLYLLLRNKTGTSRFRGASLHQVELPKGAGVFDGVPVAPVKAAEGFCARETGDFITCDALGLRLETKRDGSFIDATVTDMTGKDRAITLVYTLPASGHRLTDSRIETEAVTTYQGVGNGGLSRYPFAAVGGQALGIDMAKPAFFRVGYAAGSGELYAAFDIALTPEKLSAQVRLCKFAFDAKWGFRAALAKYYELFPDHFRCRTPEQGIWMPFHAISKVEGWQDFGFKFKEGTNESAWDTAHGILTFRYTEPMTWWMAMKKEEPRTLEAALAHARQLTNKQAQAFITSAHHDEQGQSIVRLLDTPWCQGAVWSMNSMPGIPGDVTDFKNKLAGIGKVSGEYVDSSEGYVTNVLDFRQDHFAAVATPLTFAHGSRRPAIFRGLIAFEYVRAFEREMHAKGKLMMANGTPSGLCWLVPWLDVLGTETDWNRGGKWRPMADAELLYRRALCGPKPYCFLMNTVFDKFPHNLVEKYMQRSLAYGMFPGFFSADASTGHYFSRRDLYDRDRPLFKKYVPLCRRVAEAVWQPVTLARSSDPKVHVERFGANLLTVFNDSAEERTAVVTWEGRPPGASRELVSGAAVKWSGCRTTLTLKPESVAVIEMMEETHD